MARLAKLKTPRNQSGRARKLNKSNVNTIILTIFFSLFGVVIVGRLFWLQVVKHDYYLARAQGQHQFSVQIAPVRGQIFVQNGQSSVGNELYSIATNRRFYTLYSVPRDLQPEEIQRLRDRYSSNQSLPVIIEPRELAELLFEAFDQPKVLADIDKLEEDRLKQQIDEQVEKLSKDLNSEEMAIAKQSIIDRQRELLNDPFYQEMALARRQAAIEEQSEIKIAEYFAILNKGDDPYELIDKKLEADQILRLYFKILTHYWGSSSLHPEDLIMDGDNIVWQPVGEEAHQVITINGLGQTSREYRYYPEKNIGAQLLGFVSFVNEDDLIGKGNYGLEGTYDDLLAGRAGLMQGERAANRVAILEGRSYQEQTNGADLILTIDRSIQNLACSKLSEAVKKHQADSGSVVIIDPKTGEIMAMCSAPDFDPNNYQNTPNLKYFNSQPTFEAYEPGSIFKAITMAIGIDQGKINPQTTYQDDGWVMVGKNKINNSDFRGRGLVNMVQVLQDSLNTGMVFVLRKIGISDFRDSLKKFGFGEKTGIDLLAESAGNINNLYQKFGQEINAATAAFGQGINVTTLQMAMAFGVLANQGQLMRPYIVKEIINADGSRVKTEPQVVGQPISAQAAQVVSGMLVNVVEDGHGQRAKVDGYYVAGKTGTAQVPRKDGRGYLTGVNIGSFAGYAPVDDPAFVMVVRIDHPRTVVWAESSAAPLFGEIADFILKYKQIPAQRSD